MPQRVDKSKPERSATDGEPVPPRYWWLKRILVAVGVLVLLLVVFRLWWGWEAQRRLDAKIAEVSRRRSAGDARGFPAAAGTG